MVSEEVYQVAEKSLIDWVELCIANKLSMPDIVFILQFRIYDINRMALRHFEDSKGSNPEEPIKAGGTD